VRQLDIRGRRLLLADWFANLARESGLDLEDQCRTSSGKAFTLGATNAFHVTAHFIEKSPFLKFVASDPGRQGIVDTIAQQAFGHVERGDLGGVVWYSTDLQEVEFKLSASFMGPLLERLGSQTRVLGWRRLGSNILLEFTEDLPADWDEKKKPLFAPKVTVHVHIAAPGPCAGPFSSHLAHNVVEIVAAICTFALGRSVVLPTTFPRELSPSKSEILPQLAARQADRDVHTLARKGIPLDIFSPLALPGGFELFQRVRASLLAFDAAVRQERDPVACILYVVAAESLATPYTKWRDSKLTKRFIKFFDELMPTDLNRIIAHGRFEETFGIRRGKRSPSALRRELLDRIYDYRSGQVHEGLDPSYRELVDAVGMGLEDEVRRSLFAGFAEGAILQYLAAPRVSLIGHPAFELTGPAPAECGGEAAAAVE
jgi:hypothetical protein